MKKLILQKISQANLEKIFDTNSFEEIDWIWVNQEVFRDILFNLKIDEYFGEEILEKFLREVDYDEMLNVVSESFQAKGYTPVNQYLFAQVEKGFKPTKDIETTVFMKERLHRKLLVKLLNIYRWILKAMAIDVYFKMELGYQTLKETYEELFEENNRMIEDLLSMKSCEISVGEWKFNIESKELYFYKHGKFYSSWSEGEANAKFEELM